MALRSSICELRRVKEPGYWKGWMTVRRRRVAHCCLSSFIIVISWVDLQCSCLPMTLFMDGVIIVAGRRDFYDALWWCQYMLLPQCAMRMAFTNHMTCLDNLIDLDTLHLVRTVRRSPMNRDWVEWSCTSDSPSDILSVHIDGWRTCSWQPGTPHLEYP